MFVGKWFGKKSSLSQQGQGQMPLQKGVRRKHSAQHDSRHLRMEELEDRRLLAVYVVQNFSDVDSAGNTITGSLRQAIELSNASATVNDQIVFADFLFEADPSSEGGVGLPSTISLNGGELAITDEVQILGPGSGQLTIQQTTTNSRVFNVTGINGTDRASVTIGGMTISGGNLITEGTASRGGGIRNEEALTLIEVAVTGNSAAWGGGGIFNTVGSLTLERSLVQGNTSGGGGGGILNGTPGASPRPTTQISNSTISANSTGSVPDFRGFGGGVFNFFGDVTIQHSTISENSANVGGGGIATYGIPADADPGTIPTVTSVDHTIVAGNSGGDVFEVYTDNEGELLDPDFEILTYNIIQSGGNVVPTDGKLYQVVYVPQGITWADANNAVPGGLIHLATPSTPEENEYIFNLIDDPLLWREFAVEEENAPADGETHYIGPWLGGFEDALLGWEWTTNLDPATAGLYDAPFADFDVPNGPNWEPTQPDDGSSYYDPGAPPDPLPEENALHYFATTPAPADTWGDLNVEPEDEQLPVAFVIEYEEDAGGTNQFGVDPLLLQIGDYAGSTNIYHPDAGSPAIDAGDPLLSPSSLYSQRGRHFSRIAGNAIDIGAVEVQAGIFPVDILTDELDLQYSWVWEQLGPDVYDFDDTYSALGETGGDFSLREALQFSALNPLVDTITFEAVLDPTKLLSIAEDADPVPGTAAPTILMSAELGDIVVDHEVIILGPTSFELEIDASGTDPTPTINNADGTRIFRIDDGDSSANIDVFISGLTLVGGDVLDSGGGIWNRENLTLGSSTIRDNFASNDGGGIFTEIGNLVLDSTTINGNLAGNNGGGAFLASALGGGTPITVEIRNSTVSGNSSVYGAGIYNADTELLVQFSTITQNSSTASGAPFPLGAGIASASGLNAITQVSSSIIAENDGGDVELLFGATNIQSLGYNMVGDGNAAVVFNQPGDMQGILDPMLSSLSNTGGLRETHRPLPGSPAIDAGDPFALPGQNNVPLFDQRGLNYDRVVDGLQDTKVRIDIGAYESQAATFVVDTLNDENDGNTSQGFFSLREAIDAANQNPFYDTITFDPLLFGGTIQIGPALLLPGTDTTITITDSVNIIGLGETSLTIDGLLSSQVIDNLTTNSDFVRLFDIDDGDLGNEIEVIISDMRIQNFIDSVGDGGVIHSHENLTIQNTTFVNNSTQLSPFVEEQDPLVSYSGGAIYQRYGELTLDNVLLTANSTKVVDGDGGAIYVRDADLNILNNSVITGNSTSEAYGSGGGVYIRGGTLSMSYSNISSNLAPGGEADGGGLFGYQAILNIDSSIISGNSMTGSNSEGAGIFSKDSELNLTNSVVSVNSTTGSQSEGAGLYISGGTAQIDSATISLNTTTGLDSVGGGIAIADNANVEIVDTTIDRNSTTGIGSSGGGIYNLSGTLLVRNSTISNNTVTGTDAVGGGVYSNTGLGGNEQTTLLNSTISGNSSDEAGGGVYNANGIMFIQHSTITNNEVPIFGYGGGVGSYGDNLTLTVVYSSIISGNSVTDVDRVGGTFTETFVSQGYNVIGTGLSLGAFNNSGDQVNITNALLGPLADNGGPTETHALLEGSPAINAGDPSFSTSNYTPSLLTDQRGDIYFRVVEEVIDIGAFEVQPLADFTADGLVTGDDFMTWLRNFGTTNADKADGDADGNDVVDGDDLEILLTEYGESTVVVTTVVAAATAPSEENEPVAEPAPEVVSTSLGTIQASREVESNSAIATTTDQEEASLELVELSLTETIIDSSIEQGNTIPIYSKTRSEVRVNLAGLKLGLADESRDKDLVYDSEEMEEFRFTKDDGLPTTFRPGRRFRDLSEDVGSFVEQQNEESTAAEDSLFELWGSEL